jgi:23S rRNA pseudouridine2605 synthase
MKLMTYLQTAQWLSRRAITALIQQQKVLVNDQIVESFGYLLTEWDLITRDGKKATFGGPTKRQTTQHIMLFHKPCGYVVSKSDPHNPTIYELLPTWWTKSYYPIGRLDKDSSGLLLLSNDPKLVHELLHPSKKLEKVYKVLVKQERTVQLSALTRGWCLVNEQGDAPAGSEPADLLKFAKITHHRTPEWPTMLTITILEGKKRHIRRVLRYLGYSIISLHRVAFGKYSLGELEQGKWVEVGEETHN